MHFQAHLGQTSQEQKPKKLGPIALNATSKFVLHDGYKAWFLEMDT